MHSLGICHGDVKPENVLVTDDLHAALCDFGFSHRAGTKGSGQGTMGYQSPELCVENEQGSPADVFAFGGFCLTVSIIGLLYLSSVALELLRV